MKNKIEFILDIYCIGDVLKIYPSSKTVSHDRYNEYPETMNLSSSDMDIGQKILLASKRSVNNSPLLNDNLAQIDFGEKNWGGFVKKASMCVIYSHPEKDNFVQIIPCLKSRSGWEEDDDENTVEVLISDFSAIGKAVRKLL